MPARLDNIVPRTFQTAPPDLTAVGIPQVTQRQQEIDEMRRRMQRQTFPTAISIDPQVTGPGQMTREGRDVGFEIASEFTPGAVSLGDVRDIGTAVQDPSLLNVGIGLAGVLPVVGEPIQAGLKATKSMFFDEVGEIAKDRLKFFEGGKLPEEKIVAAAVMTPDNKFFAGFNHGDAVSKAEDAGVLSKAEADAAMSFGPTDVDVNADLFITNEGRVLDRVTASIEFNISDTASKAFQEGRRKGRNYAPAPSSMSDKEILEELNLFRGESSGNKGPFGAGRHFSEDKEFARQFTQKGLDDEIQLRAIKRGDVFEAKEVPFAGDINAVDAAIKEAKEGGFKAIRQSEGVNQPTSVFVFDESALKAPSSMSDKEILEELRVFHGSPHKFKPEEGAPLGRFKREAVGTGEGAAAYGHGTAYVGEAPDTGRSYRDQLTEDPDMRVGGVEITDFSRKIEDKAARMPHDKAQAEYDKMQMLEDLMVEGDITAVRDRVKEFGGPSPEAVKWFEDEVVPEFTRNGVVYEAALKADKDDFLLWDKPFSEQSKKAQKAIKEVDVGEFGFSITDAERTARRAETIEDADGAGILQILQESLGGKKEASDFLESKGLKGIKYADEGSRHKSGGEVVAVLQEADGKWRSRIRSVNKVFDNDPGSITTSMPFDTEQAAREWAENATKDEGTFNYVVFAPESLEIVKMLGAGGVAVVGAKKIQDMSDQEILDELNVSQ